MMPINRKWPIEAVMDAVRKVKLRPRERITFEYVCWAGSRTGGARKGSRRAWCGARPAREGEPDRVESRAGIGYTMPDAGAVESFARLWGPREFRSTYAGRGGETSLRPAAS